MQKILIQNGSIVFEDSIQKADLLLENGKIMQIDSKIIAKNADVIDATNKFIFPAFIDIHTHLREPGYTRKEDIASGSLAAVKGGFSQVCCMPNTSPVCDNPTIVYYIKNRAKEVNLCKVHPIGAVTSSLNGQKLTEVGKMKELGVVAISDDGRPVENAAMMANAMQYAANFGLKVLSHCEDSSLAKGGSVNEGTNATKIGVKGIPKVAEEIMIARDILLAEYYNLPIHICHVSTKTGVQLIREAKLRGVQVTCESCPHYFILTDDCILSLNANAKVNPPIREEEDRIAIINGIIDGTIDCIVTDHAPHHEEEKNCAFDLAAFGISGLETSFALSYTHLVKTHKISLSKLGSLMSTTPAKILNLEGGNLGVGAVADITIVDLNKKFVIDSQKFLSKGKNTPFNGMEVYGVVAYTIVNGEVKYKGE